MDVEEIDRVIEQAVPDDATEAAKERFRDLQSNPPPEGNTAETTVDELDLDEVGALSYIFDMADNWDHYIGLQEAREGSLDCDPIVVDKQGTAPSQYPDLDERKLATRRRFDTSISVRVATGVSGRRREGRRCGSRLMT